MKQLYSRWILAWEDRLATRSTDRVVRPFEWGVEWTAGWPIAIDQPCNGHSPEEYLRLLNRVALSSSDRFFAYETPRDFQLRDGRLTFTSPVHTPYPENNTVHGQWFPARPSANGRPRKAVLVLPHFNARADQHVGLARGISLLGISALRLSLPYHDFRMPAELHRADYAVSSNIGRTLDATRQAVIDSRAAFDWLESQGYDRLGIVGTSLGSCYAFLVSAHEPRCVVNAFNHCSTFVGDVVWTGLSTRHIRQGIDGHIDLDRLRDVWMAISPVSYLEQYAAKPKKSLFVYTTYDTTFRPEFSREVVSRIQARGIDHKVHILPCGHYTLGETPFKFIDGYHLCSFFKRWL